jgi:hypothetical protein
MIVLILAVIIFLWTRGFIKESITKDIGGEIKTLDKLCSSEISIKSIVNEEDGSFGFVNNGNVPIFAFNLKLINFNDGSSSIVKINSPVNPGKSITLDPLTYNYLDYKEVKIIPILLGKTKEGAVQEYECPEISQITI